MIDFLTHPHHRHTQTFEWLKEAIGRPVRTLYGDPDSLRTYLPSLQTNPPKLLILFQLEHLAAWASCFCPVLVFPMNDLTQMTPDAYLASLKNVEWISFSRALHQRLAGLGLSSRYLQYAPDPEAFPEVSWEHGPRAYFWERLPEDLSVQAAGEILRSLDVENLEVRQTKDPLLASREQGQGKSGVEGWRTREEYLRFLSAFNVYVASRRHEGLDGVFGGDGDGNVRGGGKPADGHRVHPLRQEWDPLQGWAGKNLSAPQGGAGRTGPNGERGAGDDPADPRRVDYKKS